MKELSLQALVVGSVRRNDGFAFKMANRFLVGIPDLLIQVLGCPTSLWEVKQGPELYQGTRVKFNLTPHQYSFLNRFWKAGGVCGVIHFMVGRQHLYMGIFDMEQVHKGVYANSSYFTELPRGKREEVINQLVRTELGRHIEASGVERRLARQLRPDGPSGAGDKVHLAYGARLAGLDEGPEGVPGHDSD